MNPQQMKRVCTSSKQSAGCWDIVRRGTVVCTAPKLAHHSRLNSQRMARCPVQNCSDLTAYMSAQLDFACAWPVPEAFNFMKAKLKKDSAHVLPPCYFENTAMVHTAASEGAILLGGFYAKCVLGQSSFVGPNARVSRSVIYGLGKPQNNAGFANERVVHGHARGIGANVVLHNVIVCSDVSIGDNVTIVNRNRLQSADLSEEGIVIQNGVVIVLEGAVIRDWFSL
jgi:ADP-glucose pyrophosphorylase